MKIQLSLLSIFCLIISIQAAPQEDLVDIKTLPNLTEFTNYTSKVYSGYLPVSDKVSLHYVFFESQHKPEEDPVILWLNGGPGCSSMLGFLYEHGPFVFPDGSKEFVWNDNSWNTFANVIYLEAPSCVGYSYCADPYEKFNDLTTAQNNLAALKIWFTKFSEFKKNEFYVAGESYGGMYVPYLAYMIDQSNSNREGEVFGDDKINFKGFMVGNGLTEYNVDLDPAVFDMFARHQILSPLLITEIKAACTFTNFTGFACDKIWDKYTLGNLLGDLNIYDIYRTCYHTVNPSRVCSNLTTSAGKYFDLFKPSDPTIKGCTPPCVDSIGADAWLNNPDVKKGLHIQTNVTQEWYMCGNIDYQSNQTGSYWIYEYMVSQRDYKILIYSGDTDAAVPTLGTIRWIRQLVNQYKLAVEVPQSIWYLPDEINKIKQVGGYYTSYQGLDFIIVKGVGHMAPQWQRSGMHQVISQFLTGDLKQSYLNKQQR